MEQGMRSRSHIYVKDVYRIYVYYHIYMVATPWNLEKIYNYLCGARLLPSHCSTRKCINKELDWIIINKGEIKSEPSPLNTKLLT